MRWPWSRKPQVLRGRRGLLVLLPDDRVVVGCPEGTTDEMAADVYRAVHRWIERGETLVLPFMCDVEDKR